MTNFIINRKEYVEKILYIMFFCFLFDPGDNIFHLKLPLFMLLVVICFFSGMTISKIELKYLITFLGILFYALLVGVIRGGSISFGIGILMSSVLLLLMPIFRTFKIDAMQIFARTGLIIAVIIILFYFVKLFMPVHIVQSLYLWGNEKVAFTIDFRYYGSFRFPCIYFHASPMLIISEAYYTQKFLKNKSFKNCLFMFIMVIGFFMTGSRNNILVSLIVPAVLFFKHGSYKVKSFIMLIGSIVVICSIPVLKDFFDVSDYSNSIKLGYFPIYAERISEEFGGWICGCGLGSTTYVPAVNRDVYLTELTYLNCIFWFGVPLSIFFFSFLSKPMFLKMDSNMFYVKVIYIGFLYLCSLNPFMFNSVGITVLAITLYHLYEYPKIKK